MINEPTVSSKPDLTLVNSILGRSAALWVGKSSCRDDHYEAALARLIRLPWSIVICEETSGSIADLIEQQEQGEATYVSRRGHIHCLASDPTRLSLPERSLPVYFINGIDGRSGDESSAPGTFIGNRRRLNILAELISASPQRLVAIGGADGGLVGNIRELWSDPMFRPLLYLVSDAGAVTAPLGNWCRSEANAPSSQIIGVTATEFEASLAELMASVFVEDRIFVSIRNLKGASESYDLSSCDLPEQPLTAKYDIIRKSEIVPIMSNDLELEEITGFFDRSDASWRPYAAGLPWMRNHDAADEIERVLRDLHSERRSENGAFYISSEFGAGGTTMLRAIAHAIATRGYPVLVAKPVRFKPASTEVETFLYRAHKAILEQRSSSLSQTTQDPEVPWMLAFDAIHWSGREAEMRSFFREVASRKRKIVMLVVLNPPLGEEIRKFPQLKSLLACNHDISRDDAIALGRHINVFLEHHGRAKREQQWLKFWEDNRQDINNATAHFWIALEFWLKGVLDIGGSVKSLLFEQFKNLAIEPRLRLAILEVAALSVDRVAMPESMLPRPTALSRPMSTVLDDIRADAPSLGLIRGHKGGQYVWAMSLTLLGRYLLDGVFDHRGYLEELGLGDVYRPEEMRLKLLGNIAVRRELGEPENRDLAVEFSQRILKIDKSASMDFLEYWREVLRILDSVDSRAARTNRMFIHHASISRRRIAMDKMYGATLAERKDLLRRAISDLDYALGTLGPSSEDESDINLCNSLALAYYDLAQILIDEGGDEGEIRIFRDKAVELALRAEKENPSSPYVLETAARLLLQNAKYFKKEAVFNAVRALGYIYQAMQQDLDNDRQHQYTRMTDQALDVLKSQEGIDEISGLFNARNPLGYLARAWILITSDLDPEKVFDFKTIDRATLQNALAMLSDDRVEPNWMILRFRYDILRALKNVPFADQLKVLDDLKMSPYSMPLQMRLEYAILLHQVGRHHEAQREFYDVRIELKERDVYVVVPPDLTWLYDVDGVSIRVCEAKVERTGDYRSRAKVRELNSASVPFRPQDFGQKSMQPGHAFRCSINFGANGPFISAPKRND